MNNCSAKYALQVVEYHDVIVEAVGAANCKSKHHPRASAANQDHRNR